MLLEVSGKIFPSEILIPPVFNHSVSPLNSMFSSQAICQHSKVPFRLQNRMPMSRAGNSGRLEQPKRAQCDQNSHLRCALHDLHRHPPTIALLSEIYRATLVKTQSRQSNSHPTDAQEQYCLKMLQHYVRVANGQTMIMRSVYNPVLL